MTNVFEESLIYIGEKRMLISILEKINNFNEFIFAPLDGFIESFGLPEWAADALIDSFHLLPFLFFIFILIELFEFYFSNKIDNWIKKSEKSSILVASLASIFPQCGFSVIASSLYTKRMITKGCLIAVYLGTSDEAIPILLAHPSKAYLVIPIVGIKLFIAILMGYFIDLAFAKQIIDPKRDVVIEEEGCCKHSPESENKRELILHPLFHTFNIFWFILVITLILNFCLENIHLGGLLTGNSSRFVQPVIASFVGLIPNCAVSIAITMMLIKGTITFGTAMSGLLSNAGLGLLVLLKNNDFKDTLKIIFILLVISVVSGYAINFFG